jgi:hypothetical protein
MVDMPVVFMLPDCIQFPCLGDHVQVHGPQVGAFGVVTQDVLEHGLAALRLAVLELHLGKLGNRLHICTEHKGS